MIDAQVPESVDAIQGPHLAIVDTPSCSDDEGNGPRGPFVKRRHGIHGSSPGDAGASRSAPAEMIHENRSDSRAHLDPAQSTLTHVKPSNPGGSIVEQACK
jgi:hypothetical protein